MTLEEWFEKKGEGERTRMAIAIGANQAYFYNRRSYMTLPYARRVVAYTKGEVPVAELIDPNLVFTPFGWWVAGQVKGDVKPSRFAIALGISEATLKRLMYDPDYKPEAAMAIRIEFLTKGEVKRSEVAPHFEWTKKSDDFVLRP